VTFLSIPSNFFIFCYLLSRDDEETTGHFHFRPGFRTAPRAVAINLALFLSISVWKTWQERSSFLRGRSLGKGEIRKLKNFSRNPNAFDRQNYSLLLRSKAG